MQATLVIKSRLGPCEHPTIKSKSITNDLFRTLMFTPFTTSSFILYVTWLPLPTRVDQWVAATIDYVCRQMDSGIDHDVVKGYIGRR